MDATGDTGSQWVTVAITLPADDADLASGILWEAGAAGIEERAADVDEDCELRAGLLAAAVDGLLGRLHPDWVISVEAVDPDEGLDAWREFAQPWRAGGRLVIVPSWSEPPAWCRDDDIVLSIDPGRSFGSGSHPTTRMCLAELEHLVRDGDSVADIGCGSGVLAVAAVRLGALSAVGVDTDPEAIEVSRRNASRTGVADRTSFALGSVEALVDQSFDLIVANIGAHVLRSLAVRLCSSVSPDGAIVLSGVLAEQVDEVLASFASEGLALVSTAAEDDWRALVLRRAH